MEKLLFFAFVLSPGVLFTFLRAPELPALTLAAQTPCDVTAVYSSAYGVGLNAASGQVGRFAELSQ